MKAASITKNQKPSSLLGDKYQSRQCRHIHGAVVEYKSFLKLHFQEAIYLWERNSYFLDGYY